MILNTKRKSLKLIVGIGTATPVVANAWMKPVISTFVLPVHAQASTISDSNTTETYYLDAGNVISPEFNYQFLITVTNSTFTIEASAADFFGSNLAAGNGSVDGAEVDMVNVQDPTNNLCSDLHQFVTVSAVTSSQLTIDYRLEDELFSEIESFSIDVPVGTGSIASPTCSNVSP